jgi:hypothetical protein
MNSLDAIILLTTSAEINNGMFFNFCNQFRSMPKTNLEFIIFVNNTEFNEALVSSYLVNIINFKSIKITNLNIPADKDIYIKVHSSFKKEIPALGLISGPNIMFFSAMRSCYKFNTVLLLETDCLLKHNCFDTAKAYIKSSSDFLIAGSKYLGCANINMAVSNLLSLHNTHLNGVAFYNTGSDDFKKLIDKAETYIQSKIKSGVFAVPYDMALTDCLLTGTTAKDIISNRRTLSKFTTTTFILNLSPECDIDISYEEIRSVYPNYIILHTKKRYWEVFQ